MLGIAITEGYGPTNIGFPRSFLSAAAAANAFPTDPHASPMIGYLLGRAFQPFPSILAMAVANPIIAFVISIGFLANAFQVTCNSIIGPCIILNKMSKDGVLPQWQCFSIDPSAGQKQSGGVEKWKARPFLKNVYRLYALSAFPIMAGYCVVPKWQQYTLGVTFACGYVFMGSTLAALSIWYRGGKNVLIRSGFSRRWLPALYLCILLGVTMSAAMEIAFLIPQLGQTGVVSILAVLSIIVFASAVVFRLGVGTPKLNRWNVDSEIPESESS
jgi:hypothetical protein